MMRKYSILLVLLIIQASLFANDSIVITFSFLDIPYVQHSVESRNKNKGMGLISNPSMDQSLRLSQSFYTSIHYGLYKAFKPNTKSFGYQYFALIVADYITFCMPLGDAWLHEEYHRAVLTKHDIHSYNAVYDMKIGGDYINVNDVLDEDLIRMKRESNPDFVRASAAGIEGEILLVHELHKDAFSSKQYLPHYLTYLGFVELGFIHLILLILRFQI